MVVILRRRGEERGPGMAVLSSGSMLILSPASHRHHPHTRGRRILDHRPRDRPTGGLLQNTSQTISQNLDLTQYQVLRDLGASLDSSPF
jgi:hypothetical protein